MEYNIGTLIFNTIPNFIADMFNWLYELLFHTITITLPGGAWNDWAPITSDWTILQFFLVMAPGLFISAIIIKLILDTIPIL